MTHDASTRTTPGHPATGDPGTDDPGTGDRGLSRRGFLRGATVAAATSPLVLAGVPAVAAPAGPARGWGHAVGAPRGADIAVTVGREQQGRFGMAFPKLPAYAPPDALLSQLAGQLADPRPMGKDPSDGDAGDNPEVTGGYTFLGQFIDHDSTRDVTPLGHQQADPKALRNLDTPFLDLGSVYGRGPDADPRLYDPARPGWLAVGDHDGVPDLPRAADGSAHIGDPRNDENLVVAQLHAGFLHFHNRLMAEGRSAAEAQRLTTWHYQWLVVHEFLPRIVGQDVTDRMAAVAGKNSFYKPKNRPMIPLEFSVAAYRFGHSMIRPEYEMNDADTGPVFPHPDDPRDDLRGGRPVPTALKARLDLLLRRARPGPPGGPQPLPADGHPAGRAVALAARHRRRPPGRPAGPRPGRAQPAARQAARAAVRTGRGPGAGRAAAGPGRDGLHRPGVGGQDPAVGLRAG